MPLRSQLLGLAAGALLAATPTAASAHAVLVRTEPGAGVVVPAEHRLTVVSLWLSEPVAPAEVVVLDGNGRRLDRQDAHSAPDDARTIW